MAGRLWIDANLVAQAAAHPLERLIEHLGSGANLNPTWKENKPCL
jgi:hypothetical protein